MLRVIVIDDEPLARQSLRRALATLPDIALLGEADSAATAAPLIARERPHALFLDIRMPRADGFELLRRLDVLPKVVFVTAHTEHAVRAFEIDAVDYLLKPVRDTRLAQAVARLRTACGLDVAAPADPTYGAHDRLCLRTPGRTLITPLTRLVALQADGDFTRVHVAGEPPLLICQTLGAYEKTLPAPPFARLDRSLMLNLPAIVRTRRLSRDEEHVWCDGVEAPFILGRRASTELARRLAA